MSATLLKQRGSQVIDYNELAAIPIPESMGRFHRPIPHKDMIDCLRDNLSARGFKVSKEKYSIRAQGLQLFGVMDIQHDNWALAKEESSLSLGFRHGNDMSMALNFVAGAKVLVCDNMMLSGDSVFCKTKHTQNTDLPELFKEGLDTLEERYNNFLIDIDRMKNQTLRRRDSTQRIYDAFVKYDLLPMRLMQTVDGWYYETPDNATDCQGNTVYALHNAFTRAIKDMKSPVAQFEATVRVGQYFSI